MMITTMNKYGDPNGDGRGVLKDHHYHLGVTLKYKTIAQSRLNLGLISGCQPFE
jgi:hypothetical protein